MRRAVMLVGWLGAGCAGSMSREPVQPAGPTSTSTVLAATASPAVRTLRVLIEDRVILNADGDVPKGFENELRGAVQRGMLQAGMAVVSDAGKPHDLVARLEVKVRAAAYLIHGTVTLTLDSAGILIDQVQAEGELAREDRFADDQARKLVSALTRSPRLAAFAENRRGPPQTLVSPISQKTPGKNNPKSEATETARARFKQGTVYYNLNRYKEALAEFEAAYLVQPDPAFLFNIAQCHRKTGNAVEAVKFYRTYLREDPRAPNRSEVEKRIQELEESGGSTRH